MRKSTAAPNDPRIRRGEQQLTPAGVSAASAAQPQGTTIEEKPGYGHFNQARFLALQAVPDDTGSSDGPNERSSLSDGPAPPKYSVTAANAEPVAPRGTHRDQTIGGPGSTVQAVDQLLDEISSMSQSVSAGRKRRASDGDVTAVSAAKRQLVTAVPLPNGDATHRMVTRSQALLPGTNNVAAHEGSAVQYNSPQTFSGPTCTHCFQNGIFNCNGKAHCDQGGSHKCYYVLCDPATCQGAACVKIHSSEYDLKKRKPGQVRRLVIGDDESLPGGQWDRKGHGRAVIAMGGATDKAGTVGKFGANGKTGAIAARKQPFAGIPRPRPMPMFKPTQGINSMPQSLIKDEVSDSQGHHPFDVPDAVRWASSQFDRALMPGPARSNPMPDSGAIKVETSDG